MARSLARVLAAVATLCSGTAVAHAQLPYSQAGQEGWQVQDYQAPPYADPVTGELSTVAEVHDAWVNAGALISLGYHDSSAGESKPLNIARQGHWTVSGNHQPDPGDFVEDGGIIIVTVIQLPAPPDDDFVEVNVDAQELSVTAALFAGAGILLMGLLLGLVTCKIGKAS